MVLEKAEEKAPAQPDKKSVSLVGVIAAHYILALGIAAIGRQAGNKIELYAGVAFAIVYLAMAFVLLKDAVGYAGLAILGVSLLSWAYIAIRLFLLRNEVQIKII